jgi:hypothetical protein
MPSVDKVLRMPVLIFGFAGIFLFAALSSLAWLDPPIGTPGRRSVPDPGSKVLAPQCKCSTNPRGYTCEQILGFKDYEWTHEKAVQSAEQIVTLASTLPEKKFTIAVRGLADSKSISKFKTWDQVDPLSIAPRCRGRRGLISNHDLALLRSCTTAREIERRQEIERREEAVGILEPVAYEPSEDKYGDAYKAAIIYLLGDNGGCSR